MLTTVIGAGGIGTRLIPLIKHASELIVMDGDKFERGNLNRQLFPRSAVRKNKADVMVQLYDLHSSRPEMLYRAEQLEGSEFVICVPDNHKCRLIALDASDLYCFPIIIAGNKSGTANAMYYHPKFKGTSVDPRVRYPDMLEEAIEEQATSCLANMEAVPQTALANSIASDFASSLFLYWAGLKEGEVSDEITEKYAPFEHIWRFTEYETIRGVRDE